MKKEFLDFLYELRGKVQLDIDKLVELSKQYKCRCCENMSSEDEVQAELRTRRSQIQSINDSIQKYLELHKFS